MRKVMVALAVVAALYGGRAAACDWAYGTDLRGVRIDVEGIVGDEIVQQLNDPRSAREWEESRRRYEHLAATRNDIPSRNDYAVTLMHTRQAKLALPILQAIEKEQPGLYPTAANLGTAYELAGDNPQALRWIREAIRRNPDSHYGTEWLHVRILEAKLALASDPQWLNKYSILGIDFGRAVVPKRPVTMPQDNDGKPVSLDDLKEAVAYQLKERYQFVAAPDAVVGSLLFDWANLSFRTDVLETAAALYREAIRYGAPQKELAAARLARVTQMLKDFEERQ